MYFTQIIKAFKQSIIHWLSITPINKFQYLCDNYNATICVTSYTFKIVIHAVY